ncbi:MAG: ATP synthase F1 subunit delta [Clostridia bacterium]|nr:ATP synthase F1 subunit delta [Clostridia bacterium]
MNEIGKEYGAALFMLAVEERAQKEYSAALAKVKAVFTENPEYMEFLTSPSIPLSERLSAIEAAFGSTVPEQVLSYLQLMCEKGRITYFGESAEEFEALLSASERISTAKITSAVELTDEEKRKLTAKLEALYKGKIRAEYYIDESLLGGLIVEVDGNVMDGSLRHRLREVKEVIQS